MVTSSPKPASHRWKKRLITIIVILFLCLLAYEVVTLVAAFRSLQSGAALLVRSSQLAAGSGSLDSDKLEEAGRLRTEAERLILPAERRIHDDAALSALRPVPLVGKNVQAVQSLAAALGATVGAEADLLSVERLYTVDPAAQTNSGTRLLALLTASRPYLASADARLRPAVQALDSSRTQDLLPQIATPVSDGDAKLHRIADTVAQASQAAQLLPPALGDSTPKRYLLILANPAELRPAGGLAGNIGTITFDRGQPTDLRIEAYPSYTTRLPQCFAIPQPLREHFRFYHNCLEMGDATWDPDFPSSALLEEQMYGAATSQGVDGTISFDPYAVAAILSVTGPIDIPTYGSLNSQNFFDRVDTIVNVDNDTRAITVISQTVLARALALPPAKWPTLGTVLLDEVRGRHIQTALHDPTLAKTLNAQRADGSLLPSEADFELAVDANMSRSKADHYMTKTAEVRVEAFPSGLDRHELILRYDYPLPTTPDPTDTALNLDGQYVNYLRVYLPEMSNVSTSEYLLDGKPTAISPGGQSLVSGHRVVALTFLLPRGHRGEVRIFYTTALKPGRTYSLLMQKQAGIPERPTTLIVSHPGGIARLATRLTQDAKFEVIW